ncbi:MAG TPA: hypothetical protein VLF19_12820 [Methylomirabilota bacterium]|nr:hypothetical protein [Methylomirabilota bacterium]
MMRVLAALSGLLILLVALEIALVPEPHRVRGAFAVIGLVSCVTIVLVSKLLGKVWLQRPEPRD